jgi:type IV secretion system protein VirB8
VKDPFAKGTTWDDERSARLEKSSKLGWKVASGLGVLLAIMTVALASAFPLRRTVPYLVSVDSASGNVEVLQAFDNRKVGMTELQDKYWASKYVLAREQYNWWLVGPDYELVQRLSNPEVVQDYNAQFTGEKSLDKVFGQNTDRRVKILSVRPVPTSPNTMVVRWERTTVQKGAIVEQPTIFASTLAYRFVPKVTGAEIDLLQNPLGYEVYAYRRDVEQAGAPIVTPAVSPAAAPAVGPAPVGSNAATPSGVGGMIK